MKRSPRLLYIVPSVLSGLLLATPGVCVSQRLVPAGYGSPGANGDSAIPRPATPGVARDATLGAFPGSLASNGVSLIAPENLLPLLVGSGLALMAHSVDDELQGDIAGEASAVGETGDFLGDRFFVMGSVAGLFAAGQIAPEGRFRSVTFDVAQGLILNGVLTSVLKLAVGRERPDGRNSRSFPSGHTSTSFMYATVLGRHLGPKVGIPAALLATFIGVSRIEHEAHFLSDVVAGATLGFIVGRTVTAHVGRDAAERVVSLSPMAVPGGGGVVVTLRW